MSGSSKSVSRSPSISRSQRSVSVSRSPRYRRKRSRSRSVSVSRSPRRAREESPNGRSRYHRRRGSFSRSRSPLSRSPSQERKYRKTHRSRYGGRSPRHGHERSSHGSSRDRRGGHHDKEGYNQGGRFGGNFRGSGFNRRSGRGRDNFYSRPDFGIPNYDFDNPSNSGFMMHDYPPGHGAQFGNMGSIPHLVPGGPGAHHHGVPDGQSMANPRDLPTLVSINYFTDYMRWVNPESQMAEDEIYQAYTQYKKEFHYRQLRSFFNQHRNDNWFMDKYWNEAINDRLKEAYPQKVQLFDTFVKELQQGKFDSLNYDEPASSTNGAQQEEEQDNESEPNIIFIKSIPPSISRHQVQELFSKFSGFQHLMLSDPNPLKKFHRLGWVIFEQGINVSKLLESELKSCCIDEFEFHLAPHKNKSIPRLTSPQFSNPARLRHDLSKVSKLTKELELYFAKAGQPDTESPNLFNGSEHINQRMDIILADRSPSPARSHEEGSQSDDIPISEVKKRLDLHLAYLRNVFHYCYYCYALCETSHDLIRKCSTKHYRGTDPKASTANKSSESWIKSFEQKIDLQIHGLNSQELENFGGQSLEKEIDLYASSQVLVIESNKCRCKLCNKLFKGAEFVEKHVKTKHKADFQEIIDEVQYFNNYIRDSQRVTPPSNVTPLGANTFQGHFPHSNFPPMNPGMIAPGPPGPMMHFGVNPEGMAPTFPMSMHPQPMAFQTMHPNPRYRGNRGFSNNNNNNSSNNVNTNKPSVPATRNLAPPDPRRQMRSYVDLDEPGPSADSTA